MNIRIMTDSAADFTQQELRERGICCVPLQVTFGTDTYTDGVDLTSEIFWQRLTSGENPKTSQPSPDAFLTEFEAAKAAGDAVVYIPISSALSGTMQSAVIARDMADYEHIYIVDSRTAAVSQKVIVLEACRLRDEGKLDAAQLAAHLEAFRERVKLYACLDTLEYLARVGRIPQAAASIGSLVQLKPLITLSPEGKVALVGKGIGRHRAFDGMLKFAKAAKFDTTHFPIIPIYACTPDNCKTFVDKMTAAGIDVDPANITAIGATIATHIGPAAYGFVYVEAE